MSSRISAFGSSVGTKILVGLTGLALFLYLITHIAGNLLVFLGPTIFNKYSHALLSNPLIPVIEIGLALIVIIHVYKTVRMFLSNQQARPVGYVQKNFNVSSFANGAAHTLEFRGDFNATGTGVTNFMVDDVRLESCQ